MDIPQVFHIVDKEYRLHQILGLASRVATLLAICDMTELTVLENGLHLDDAAPATGQDFLTFTSCVLRNIAWHIRIPPINSQSGSLYNILAC